MITASWNVLLELAPWLLLGAALAGSLHVLVPRGLMQRQLQGSRGVWKAVGVGVPLPLCSCGVIPVGLGLKKQGASDGAVVAFLISTPQTGVDSILVSASMLGWPLALFKVAAALATGVVGGLLAEAALPKEPGDLPIAGSVATEASPHGLGDAVAHALDILRSVWRWLVVGIVVSAALTLYLPQDGLTRVTAHGPLLTMLATLAFALPLYVCAIASVPVAAALVAGGLPTGAALVFLMAGPATNAATIGAVYRTLGRRPLAIYLTTIAVGSVALGLAFEALFPLQRAAVGVHQHGSGWWEVACGAALLALLAWFAVDDVRRWWNVRRLSRQSAASKQPSVELKVEGMTCGNCTSRLERALASESGVTSAVVTLNPGRAVVYGEITPGEVSEVVEREGFRASE